ncbi:carboxymuconolactone decarboxylase family protein, partial [uncultured Aquincola sp.]|uniref:carboxymuconolactone decarboxylase family protein n=1 Tax=uncultured Aquincola sp. TaxID=886556 RepID=UPI0032B21B6E
FARDNLDWRQRELATVAALSALSGVASQLQAHVRISLNVGLTVTQLNQLAATLADEGQADAGQRLLESLDSHPGG